MKKLSLDAFLDYKFLSALNASPSGNTIALTVTTPSRDSDYYHQNLWIYDKEHHKGFRQLTAMNQEHQILWDDEETILFPTIRTKKDEEVKKLGGTVYYRISTTGGEAKKAFTLPIIVTDIVKAGTGAYVLTARCDANQPEFYKMDEAERKRILKEKEKNADYEIFDEIPFWFNGSGFTNKTRNRLFLYKEKEHCLIPITSPLFDTAEFKVANNKVYFIGEELKTKPSFRYNIQAFDIVQEKTECLYQNDSLLIKNIAIVQDVLLFIATDGKQYGFSQNPWFYHLDLTNNKVSLLKEADLSIRNTLGSDCRYGRTKFLQGFGKKLYFITTQRTSTHLYAIDLAGNIELLITEEGSVDDFIVTDEAIYLTGMYKQNLQEIYRYQQTAKTLTCISAFNNEVFNDIYRAIPERLTFDLDGVEIDGWILKPIDYDEHKSYPAILNIHGGPRTIYGEVFYHEMQYWASCGYFVFFCNPQGSDGRGNQFADIRDFYGNKDYQACMKLTDEVLLKYPSIDTKRLAVTGGSYGGYMTNWIIGHTDRFACAASQRSVVNWITLHGTSDISSYIGPDQHRVSPYDEGGGEKLWACSPLKYVKNVKTPTLFIHSDEDFRCPTSEGIQMYTALTDLGVETRFCYFKGENHELSRSGKPSHRMKRLSEITKWMDKYTQK